MAEPAEQIDFSTVQAASERLKALREQTPEAPPEDITDIPDSVEEPEEHLPDEPETESVTPPETEEIDGADEYVGDDEAEYAQTLEAPAAWKAEAKEVFASLDPEIQQEIVRRDRDVEIGVRRKVDELAHQQKSLQETAEEVLALRNQYIEALKQAAAVEIQPPDVELLNEFGDNWDESRYHREKAIYEQKLRERDEKRQELQKIQDEQAQVQTQQRNQALQYHHDRLVTRFPKWRDPDNLKSAVQEIRDYISGPQYEIGPEAANAVYDADMLTMAWKAKQFDRMRAKNKPRPPRPVKPSARQRAQPAPQRDEVLASHKKSGTTDSGAAAIRALRNRQ